MFEMQSVRPQRGTTFFFSTAFHLVLALFLVVGPLWAVQEPVAPVERMVPLSIPVDLLPKPKPEEPLRMTERPAARHGGTPSGGTPARALTHVDVPSVIPDLPRENNSTASIADAEETLGPSQVGPIGATGTGDDPIGNDLGTGTAGKEIYSTFDLGVTPPVALVTTEPIYPETARRIRSQGEVILEAVIDREGYVREARILKSVNPLLDRAALEAVSTWRYRPALVGTKTVAVYLTVKIAFHLN